MLATARSYQSLARGHVSAVGLLRTTLDPLLAIAVLAAATVACGAPFDGPELILSLLVFSLTYPGSIDVSATGRGLMSEIFLNWLTVLLILAFLGYATKSIGAFDPRALLAWSLAVPVVQYAAHRAIPALLPRILAAEGYRTAVVVGANDLGRKLAQRFERLPHLGVRFAGFFDDRSLERLGPIPEGPVRGRLGELAACVKAAGADAIFVALPMASQPRILKLLDELRDTTASIYFVPDIFVSDLIQARMDDIEGMPVVAVCETPFHGVSGTIKRLSDLAIAAAAVILLAPLMLAIAAGVRLGSPGPALFTQRRYGLDGREIVIYKFRTMIVMQDGPDVLQAQRGDKRVTRFGAFLRRTSLDELPQFLNVLQGRMSVVGPRPHAVAHNETYRKLIKGYMIRHKVKPGITGWAQVNGLRGQTETLEKMKARIDYDLEYLRNWSLRLDLSIMLRTALVLLRTRNVY